MNIWTIEFSFHRHFLRCSFSALIPHFISISTHRVPSFCRWKMSFCFFPLSKLRLFFKHDFWCHSTRDSTRAVTVIIICIYNIYIFSFKNLETLKLRCHVDDSSPRQNVDYDNTSAWLLGRQEHNQPETKEKRQKLENFFIIINFSWNWNRVFFFFQPAAVFILSLLYIFLDQTFRNSEKHNQVFDNLKKSCAKFFYFSFYFNEPETDGFRC